MTKKITPSCGDDPSIAMERAASELADRAAKQCVKRFHNERGHLAWRELRYDLNRVRSTEARVLNAIKDLWSMAQDAPEV